MATSLVRALQLLVLVLLFSFPLQSLHAQQKQEIQAVEPREAVGTILMAGLVGGILGLSTLSFYERPQDHIRNISFGAGAGMIAAVLYTTWDVAEKGVPADGKKGKRRADAGPSFRILPSVTHTGSAALLFDLRF